MGNWVVKDSGNGEEVDFCVSGNSGNSILGTQNYVHISPQPTKNDQVFHRLSTCKLFLQTKKLNQSNFKQL